MTAQTRIAIAAAVATMLASLSLLSTYASASWVWPVLGAVTVVFAAAQGARLIGLPAPIGALCSIGALAVYLTAVFAHDTALFGLLPGVGEAVVGELPHVSLYPEQAYNSFRALVGKRAGADPAMVVPAHGIQALVLAAALD